MLGAKTRSQNPLIAAKLCSNSPDPTVLIRKAVGVGKIGRGPGDQASDDIELEHLGEIV